MYIPEMLTALSNDHALFVLILLLHRNTWWLVFCVAQQLTLSVFFLMTQLKAQTFSESLGSSLWKLSCPHGQYYEANLLEYHCWAVSSLQKRHKYAKITPVRQAKLSESQPKHFFLAMSHKQFWHVTANSWKISLIKVENIFAICKITKCIFLIKIKSIF